MMQENFIVTGMTCSACSAHVEKAVNQLGGVSQATVNLMTGGMHVSFEDITHQQIIDAVIAAGYGCELTGESAREQRSARQSEELRKKKRSLLLSAAFLIPLCYIAMVHMLHLPVPAVLTHNMRLNGLVQLLILLPILWAS